MMKLISKRDKILALTAALFANSALVVSGVD
jgi:hypothetical protein